MGRSFVPGLIHSLDAGVIRLLIYLVYKNSKKTVVTCHDSIQYSPEDECYLQAAVDEVYNQLIPLDFVNDLYFKPSTVNLPDKGELEKKYKEFTETLGDLDKNDLKVDCITMYPYEN